MLSPLAPPVHDQRRLAARFLQGDGIEVGACHVPLWVDTRVARVRYVDRWHVDELRALFPELDGDIVPTDVLCDITREGLAPFAAASLDFVILSNVLEHVPDPLSVALDAVRVLRPGGFLYVGLPDKDFTFDRGRAVTPLAHLIEDRRQRVTEADDEHLAEYVTKVLGLPVPQDERSRQELFDRERRRSIHVHVWNWRAMVEMFEYLVGVEAAPLALRELYLPKGIAHEAIFILQKDTIPTATRLPCFQASARLLIEREEQQEAAYRASTMTLLHRLLRRAARRLLGRG
ncbi:MAG: class I SAM-dependent methyltransferase [Gemmataceae bacterium]